MGDRRLSRNPGTIVYSVANTPGSASPSTDGVRGVVMAGGGILDLSPNSLDAQTLGLSGGGVGASAFDQAQQMDFDSMVSDAMANPTSITQEDYETLLQEVGAIQRNPLLSQEDQINAISNLLTNAEIFHDPNSLDIMGGSDAGGLLTKRIKITPAVDPGGTSNDALNNDIDTTITNADAAAANAVDILTNNTNDSSTVTSDDTTSSLVGTYDASKNAFLMPDGTYIDYNGIAGVGVDGQTISVTDGGKYSIFPDENGKAMAEHLVADAEDKNKININTNVGLVNTNGSLIGGNSTISGGSGDDTITGTGNTNTGGKFTKTGEAITTYTVVGPGFGMPTVTGNTETLDNVTPDETGGQGTGTSTGIGSGTGSGAGTNDTANTTNIMSNRSINETVFANELERIRLDPTGLLNRLFS